MNIAVNHPNAANAVNLMARAPDAAGHGNAEHVHEGDARPPIAPLPEEAQEPLAVWAQADAQDARLEPPPIPDDDDPPPPEVDAPVFIDANAHLSATPAALPAPEVGNIAALAAENQQLRAMLHQLGWPAQPRQAHPAQQAHQANQVAQPPRPAQAGHVQAAQAAALDDPNFDPPPRDIHAPANAAHAAQGPAAPARDDRPFGVRTRNKKLDSVSGSLASLESRCMSLPLGARKSLAANIRKLQDKWAALCEQFEDVQANPHSVESRHAFDKQVVKYEKAHRELVDLVDHKEKSKAARNARLMDSGAIAIGHRDLAEQLDEDSPQLDSLDAVRKHYRARYKDAPELGRQAAALWSSMKKSGASDAEAGWAAGLPAAQVHEKVAGAIRNPDDKDSIGTLDGRPAARCYKVVRRVGFLPPRFVREVRCESHVKNAKLTDNADATKSVNVSGHILVTLRHEIANGASKTVVTDKFPKLWLKD